MLTDQRVNRIYGAALRDCLEAADVSADYVVVPAGERSKSLACFEHLLDELARLGMDRRGLLVNFGGGIVSDVGGFVASAFMRGIAYANLPTTLIGQLDASVGGKVTVNSRHAKNMFGAFHHPVHVAGDPLLLATISERDFRSGMAEAILRPDGLRPADSKPQPSQVRDPAQVVGLGGGKGQQGAGFLELAAEVPPSCLQGRRHHPSIQAGGLGHALLAGPVREVGWADRTIAEAKEPRTGHRVVMQGHDGRHSQAACRGDHVAGGVVPVVDVEQVHAGPDQARQDLRHLPVEVVVVVKVAAPRPQTDHMDPAHGFLARVRLHWLQVVVAAGEHGDFHSLGPLRAGQALHIALHAAMGLGGKRVQDVQDVHGIAAMLAEIPGAGVRDRPLSDSRWDPGA